MLPEQRLEANQRDPHRPMIGAVILAGGQSRRMGVAKASLPLGEQTFLSRIGHTLLTLTPHVVAVGPQGVKSPPAEWRLPPGVAWCSDRRSGGGPVHGVEVGLQALRRQVDWAWVTSCDCPLIDAPTFRKLEAAMLVGVGNVSGVVFLDQSGRAELTSLWRTELADTVAAMCSESSISFQQLVQNLSPLTVRWDIAEGGGVIQRSLRNVNNPQDYRDLLTDLDSPSTDGMSSV